MDYKEKTVIDGETGEILSASVETVRRLSSDEFVQIYLEDMKSLMQLSTKGEIQILIWLWKASMFIEAENSIGNKVIINKQLYSLISENTGLTEGAIRNTVSVLVKKDLLIKDAKFRGIYYLNPKFFFKGKLTDRIKSFKLVLEYKMNNRKQ